MIGKAVLNFDLDARSFANARAKQPVPDSSLAVDVAISGASLSPVPGLPPLTGIEGTGHFTGTTSSFLAAKASIDSSRARLNFSDVQFTIADTRPKLMSAVMAGHVQGPVDAAVDLLSRDVLRKYNNIPGDPSQYKGQLDGTVQIDFKLGKAATPDDISVTTNLNASNVSVDKIIGTEKLENANLTIATTKSSMLVKGDGRLFSAPVAVELKKSGNAPTDASLVLTVDEAARQKRGFDLGPGFSGPVLVRLSAQLADGDRSKADAPKGETRAQVELDLTKTSIDGLLPGWIKLAGKPGKANFTLVSKADAISLEQFQLDAGNGSLRGQVSLDAAGRFDEARLTTFRMSAQDDLRVDVQKDGELLKITARGGSVDARPFITDLLAHSRAKSANGMDYDLDLKTGSLVGFNKEHIDSLDLKLRRHGGIIQKVIATGKLDSAPFKIVPTENAAATAFTLSTENAGALLSFLDMYRRMEGGSLAINLRPQAESIAGTIQIQNFVLNDEPAVRAVLTQNGSGAAGQNASKVRFNRLQGDFERSDGRIDIVDAAMWGMQIGATMGGMIDYGRDKVDLAGNLVPAYQINNLFSKIPLVGPLLGGGKNEGLFAINYRITGKASAPLLRVDPLSAIAPGIFRKIMGVADGTLNNPENLAPNTVAPGAPTPPKSIPSAPLDLRAPAQTQ